MKEQIIRINLWTGDNLTNSWVLILLRVLKKEAKVAWLVDERDAFLYDEKKEELDMI